MTSAEVRPPLCSRTSEDLGESAYGSAARAAAWVGLEQSGPWGRVAATDSHLDADLGRHLDAAASAAGARFVLVRTPGRHADDHVAAHDHHTVLLASADPAAPLLLRGVATDPRQLAGLDVAALVRGDLEAVRASVPDIGLDVDTTPVLLVCTNGRRDLCCAVRGRPVALAAAERRPDQVWETTHTGGHRFSPTGVLLPTGQTLARLDADLAAAALDAAAAGELPAALHGPSHDRGLSAWDNAVMAAVSLVRTEIGEPRLRALIPASVSGSDERRQVDVRHEDGREWSVLAERRVLGPDRPESCVKPAVPQVGWSVALG